MVAGKKNVPSLPLYFNPKPANSQEAGKISFADSNHRLAFASPAGFDMKM
jgi:hypothetical protein